MEWERNCAGEEIEWFMICWFFGGGGRWGGGGGGFDCLPS